MSDVAIRVEKLGKLYRIGREERYRTLRDTLVEGAQGAVRAVRGLFSRDGRRTESPPTIWALKDVSFEVKRGEVLGIIGRNGAGKTTLLKILSRVTEPTEGYAEIRGRVGSLLEVGTGFHPELTGRENIYLYGAILGMKKAEIQRKFDEIVAFAEVEKFIDTPVKHYSSGMYLRLAFAVAAHLEPEILLVDEVLAVGDAQFQKKCLALLRSQGNRGVTSLVVSHNLHIIERVCQTGLVLSEGHQLMVGHVRNALDTYRALLTKAGPEYDAESPLSGMRGSPVSGLDVRGLSQGRRGFLRTGEGLRAELRLSPGIRLSAPWVGIRIRSDYGQLIMHLANREAGYELGPVGPDPCVIRCDVPSLPLLPGRYVMDVVVADMASGVEWLTEGAGQIEVAEGDPYGTGFLLTARYGLTFAPSRWQIVNQSSETNEPPVVTPEEAR